MSWFKHLPAKDQYLIFELLANNQLLIKGNNKQLTVPIGGGSGAGVSSLNNLTGAISLTSTDNTISIAVNGNNLNLSTIANAGFIFDSNQSAYTLKNITNNTEYFIFKVDGSASRLQLKLAGETTTIPFINDIDGSTHKGNLMWKQNNPYIKIDQTTKAVSIYNIVDDDYITLSGSGPSGVSSLNALTGDITLSSADNSILFTKTGNVIDAKVQASTAGGNASFTEIIADVVSLTNTDSNADYFHWAQGGGVSDYFIQTLIHNNYRKLPFMVEEDNTLYITESKPFIQKNGTVWQIYDFENSAWNNFIPGNTAPIKYNGTALYLDIDTSLSIDSTSGKLGITGTVMTTITQMMNRLLALETKFANGMTLYQFTLTNHEIWIIKDNLTGICHCRWRQTSTTNGYDWSGIDQGVWPADMYSGVVMFSRPSSSSGASLQLTWNSTTQQWSSAGTGNPLNNYTVHFSYVAKS